MTKKPLHLISVPLDLGASRRGTDAGPSALKIAGLTERLRGLRYDIAAETHIAVSPMEAYDQQAKDARFKSQILSVCTQLAEAVRHAMDAGNMPLVLGGDHSIAMGTVSGLASFYRRQQQDLGLIWFDAHADMNTPETSRSGNIHGMPLAHLLGYGDQDLVNILEPGPAVKPEHVVLIGIRDVDAAEREVVRKSGVTAFTMRDIDEQGMGEVAREAIRIVTANTAGFHISFDVDGCDPSVMPGSGTLVAGGVQFREAHQLLENCADSGRIVGLEVVELNPFLDHKNVSAERAVQLIESALGRRIL